METTVPADTTNRNWLVIYMNGPDIESAEVSPSAPDRLVNVRKYRSADFPTATDCLRTIAENTSLRSLHGVRTAIAVGAAITGDTVRISRGGWIISLSGLRHLFGVQPLVANDSVALGWAGAEISAQSHKAIGQQIDAVREREGRVSVINWGLGLGSSVIQAAQDGERSAIPCEMGHTGFSPETARELALHKLLGRERDPVSWEQVLCLAGTSDVWRHPSLAMTHDEIELMQAELAGAFASNVALSTTSWEGVVFTGPKSAILAKARCAELFNRRFENKLAYRAKMKTVPRWLFDHPSAALNGCARMLADQLLREKLANGRAAADA
jgi:glucokinase